MMPADGHAGRTRCLFVTKSHVLITVQLLYYQSLSTQSMAQVPFHQNQAKVQEIIFYFTSRLRAATIATLDPANAAKSWLHHFLVWELVI